MKTIIFAGVVALALTSMAQGTAPTAAPAAQPTTTAKAPAAKKAAKAKKATPAKTKAAVEAAAPAVAQTSATATEAVAVPAAGTSTAAPEVAAAPSKKWGAKLMIDAFTGKDGVQDISNATVSTINYLGASYKLDAGSVGLRQYFTYESTSGEDTSVQQDWTVLTFGTKFSGIMGSDEIAPLFWYYVPTTVALKKNFGEQIDGDDVEAFGVLRADANIAWTLSPKWSVGYYLNPRQTLIPTQDVIKGKTASTLEATTRLVHWLSATYTINDAVNTYAYAGFDNRMATERMTQVRDDQLVGIGMEFSMLGGKLLLNPEISSTTGMKAGGKTVEGTAASFLHPLNTTYELVTVVSF